MRNSSKKGLLSSHTCEICGKKSYITRKEARRAARRLYPEETMNAYPACQVNDQYWHFGHLPDKLRQGEIDRGTYRQGLEEDSA